MQSLIAKWVSRSGKHWVEVYHDPEFKLADGRTVESGSYKGNDCGGSLGTVTRDQAIDKVFRMVDSGYFLPDKAKTAMRRII